MNTWVKFGVTLHCIHVQSLLYVLVLRLKDYNFYSKVLGLISEDLTRLYHNA